MFTKSKSVVAHLISVLAVQSIETIASTRVLGESNGHEVALSLTELQTPNDGRFIRFHAKPVYLAFDFCDDPVIELIGKKVPALNNKTLLTGSSQFPSIVAVGNALTPWTGVWDTQHNVVYNSATVYDSVGLKARVQIPCSGEPPRSYEEIQVILAEPSRFQIKLEKYSVFGILLPHIPLIVASCIVAVISGSFVYIFIPKLVKNIQKVHAH